MATEDEKDVFVQISRWKKLVKMKLSWGKVHTEGLKKTRQYVKIKRGTTKVNAQRLGNGI